MLCGKPGIFFLDDEETMNPTPISYHFRRVTIVVVVIEDKSCSTTLDLVNLVNLVLCVRIPYGRTVFDVWSNKSVECFSLGVSGAR